MRLGYVLGALAATVLLASPAKATFVSFTGEDPACSGNNCDLFLNAAKDVTSGTGDVGGQKTGVLVGFTTNGSGVNIDIDNGYSNITPTTAGTDITQLVFSPLTGEHFGDFSFRGSNDKSPITTISVTDNFGKVFTDNFLVGFGDFTRIGEISKDGEWIKSVTVTGSLDDVRQIQFSPAVGAVPLPGAVWLFGSGLAGLMFLAKGKAKRRSNIDPTQIA